MKGKKTIIVSLVLAMVLSISIIPAEAFAATTTATATKTTTVATTVKSSVTYNSTSWSLGMVVASIGTLISSLWGGCDYPLMMLMSFILLDYATGLLGSMKTHTVDSDLMYWGIIRKIAQLVIVAIAVSIDKLMNTEFYVVRLMVIYFYIGMEGISILENLVKLGVRVPVKLINVLQKLQEDGASNEQIRDNCNEHIDHRKDQKHKHQ
jgi:toxin secretion/phage lysis holin